MNLRRREFLLATWTAPALLPAGFLRAQSTNRPSPDPLAGLRRNLRGVEALFCRFEQARHLSLFKEPLRSEGFLGFQKPGRVRWETTRPYESILVSDGSGVGLFEKVEGRWRKLDVGLAAAMRNVISQIAGIMEGAYAANDRDYAASVETKDDVTIVTLTPRRESVRQVMRSVEVHLGPELQAARRVVLRESDGDFTDIRFSDHVAGAPFPPNTFSLSAPADLGAVRDAVDARARKP